MTSAPDETARLLAVWHEGDSSALDRLLELHLPWLREHVERRLGPALRARGDTGDYLQDVCLDFLRDGPRFQVRDALQFRRLMARVIENTLRDRNDWFRAKRRDLGRQQPMPSGSAVSLDPTFATSETPSRVATRDELRHWVRLALELLEPEDRKVIVAREYDDRSFVDIGRELGMTDAAVRMRWVRAVGRLAEVLRQLRAGEIQAAEP